MSKISSNSKSTLRNCQTLKISPKWQHFVKSGHTAVDYPRQAMHQTDVRLISLLMLEIWESTFFLNGPTPASFSVIFGLFKTNTITIFKTD